MHYPDRGAVIRLGARLAVSGGRASLARLVLTALGVALATTLLLLAAAADPAVRAQQRHTAWQHTTGGPAGERDGGDPLLWWLSSDGVDGRELTVLRVAATGPDSPVPLGLGHVPEPGEVYVSPALAELMGQLPADRLADRFPSAPAGTIAEDFLAGPDDLVAVVGFTEPAMRRLDALEVHEIRTAPPPHQFADFLRICLAVGAVGLIMPVLVFVSTSTRIGAARREQRFAALRLAGATPRQTTLLVAVEAGAAAVVGAALGVAGFVAARPWVARVEIDGHRSFVEDVRVAPALLALVVVAVPALAVAAATTGLRRLRISPLGVARRAARPRPTSRRLLPLLAGSAGFVATLALAVRDGGIGLLVPVMATFALMIYGIVAAGPWFTVLAARAIGRLGRRASALLAGRRLEDDPATGFRAVSGLVLAVFVASVFSGVTPALLDGTPSGSHGVAGEDALVVGLPPATSPAAATAALEAAAGAGSGPGVVLRRDPDPDRPLGDPAVGRSASTVVVACRDVPVLDGLAALGAARGCPAGGSAWLDLALETPRLDPAPYTAAEADALPAELLVVETDGTPATTDRVRTAVLRAVPGATPRLGAEVDADGDRRLVQLNRLVNAALAVTLAIAGCSLAVAVAAGIIERRRPFALLRLAGMHLGELQRTALLEAVAPLVLIALASAALGLATSAVIVRVAAEVPWRPPSVGYWLNLAGGLAVAVVVAAAALPLLRRTTAPSAVRFE
ncbi:MAG TPA: FtsX-like permease family protein [Acidimicrobiales bacterium]